MQREAVSIGGLLQVRLLCAVNTNPGYYHTVQPPAVQPADGHGRVDDVQRHHRHGAVAVRRRLLADRGRRPGLVRASTLYLNQYDDMSSPPKPALYLDDVVVTVTDGHNLVGNPNFEAGLPDGWSVSAGSAMPMISTTVFPRRRPRAFA